MKRLLGMIILSSMIGNNLKAVTDGTSFNENWRFFKGEIKGAETVLFNDDSWRKLDLPHDWAIEGCSTATPQIYPQNCTFCLLGR